MVDIVCCCRHHHHHHCRCRCLRWELIHVCLFLLRWPRHTKSSSRLHIQTAVRAVHFYSTNTSSFHFFSFFAGAEEVLACIPDVNLRVRSYIIIVFCSCSLPCSTHTITWYLTSAHRPIAAIFRLLGMFHRVNVCSACAAQSSILYILLHCK